MGFGMAQLGDIFDAIKKGFEAAEVAVNDMRSVVEALNGARSVVVTVANNTSKEFHLIETTHEHGGFAGPSPEGIIKSRESKAFGSQNSSGSIGTGAEGSVTYMCEGCEAFLAWDNPFAGENAVSVNLTGAKKNAFRVVASVGAGNERAPMRFDIFEIEMRGFDVFGAILDKWAELRWGAGPLRFPLSDEIPTFDGVGRFRTFEGGIISWHPEIGAHVVQGKILDRWLQIGREQFAYPITDEVTKPDGRGRANNFQAIHLPGKPVSSIYWLPETGAHEIFGAIRNKWIEMGVERGRLGYPVSAEHDHAGGRLQQFQGGSIFWTPQGGAVVQ